jgi:hypothetical protein
MNVTKVEYNLKKFNQENVEALLESLGLDVNNYLLSMTKPSMLSRALVGNIVDFSSRYCIICFSETEINLIMLSRINNKRVTETIKINRDEINNIKLSDSNMKFQVFKKVGKFTKINSALEVFKQTY